MHELSGESNRYGPTRPPLYVGQRERREGGINVTTMREALFTLQASPSLALWPLIIAFALPFRSPLAASFSLAFPSPLANFAVVTPFLAWQALKIRIKEQEHGLNFGIPRSGLPQNRSSSQVTSTTAALPRVVTAARAISSSQSQPMSAPLSLTTPLSAAAPLESQVRKSSLSVAAQTTMATPRAQSATHTKGVDSPGTALAASSGPGHATGSVVGALSTRLTTMVEHGKSVLALTRLHAEVSSTLRALRKQAATGGAAENDAGEDRQVQILALETTRRQLRSQLQAAAADVGGL